MSAMDFLKKYLQFCLVGGSGLAVDMLVLILLASPAFWGWNLMLSKAIAAEAALVNNYIWNEAWTFRDMRIGQNRWRQRLARLFRFNLICLAGIGLSVLLLDLQASVLHINLYLANFNAIVLVSFWNFLLNLKFGWKRPAA
jgi:dolichol-phosphate mannosyltransferase